MRVECNVPCSRCVKCDLVAYFFQWKAQLSSQNSDSKQPHLSMHALRGWASRCLVVVLAIIQLLSNISISLFAVVAGLRPTIDKDVELLTSLPSTVTWHYLLKAVEDLNPSRVWLIDWHDTIQPLTKTLKGPHLTFSYLSLFLTITQAYFVTMPVRLR